jgi:hypothetical protein
MKKFLLKNYAPVFAAVFIYNAFLLTGCLANAYLPNNHNVPLLEKKGDFMVSAAVNLTIPATFFINSTTPSAQVNLAFAPIDNLGLIFNGGYSGKSLGLSSDIRKISASENSYNTVQGFNWELGCGIVKQSKEKLFLEIYALGGSGSTTSIYYFYQLFSFSGSSSRTTQPIRVDYTTFSLQPVLGIRSSNLEVALSLKTTGLGFKIPENQKNVDPRDIDVLLAENSNTLYNLGLNYRAESALTLRYGWQNIKIQGQAGTGLFIDNPFVWSFWGSLGVQLNLSTFKEKSKF